MALRFPTRSTVIHAILAGGVLISAVLAPAAAQQTSAIDGQVAVRSDGAVYLITNGQRRWVATVQISDEELNAYPEGEPIFSGLAPAGSQPATAAQPPIGSPAAVSSPVTAAPPNPGTASTTTGVVTSPPGPGLSTGTGPITAREVGTPTGAVGEIDPQLPIEVDVDGTPKFEVGEIVTVNVKTKTGAACALAVKWPNGTEVDQPAMTADAQGRCQYKIDVPTSASVGTATLKGIVRESGRMSRQDVEFEVIPTV